ncbi:MAG TPA: ImmA/IrrE family metallo-endopeptidase [Herpetosiphonaceae bacterium]|nr:ImmA/IrrE family metallo-endopeptidase [Herpetosiphonaceae bacterium]
MAIIDPEEAAQQILRPTGYRIPVDIYAIAKEHNVEIRSQTLEDTVSGMLVIKDQYAIIGVNENHHPNRQRFTIAHELGHYILHRDKARVFVDSKPVFFRDEVSAEGIYLQEIQANAFAAALLMPAKVLRDQVTEPLNPLLDPFDEVTVHTLATELGVSVQALTIRLTRLGLIID